MTRLEYRDRLLLAADDGTFPSIRKLPDSTTTDGAQCMYRADGTAECKQRCAGGLLIPDDLYQYAMEHRTVLGIAGLPAMPLPDGMTPSQLLDVQKVHDRLARQWDPVAFKEEVLKLECFADLPAPGLPGGEEKAPC